MAKTTLFNNFLPSKTTLFNDKSKNYTFNSQRFYVKYRILHITDHESGEIEEGGASSGAASPGRLIKSVRNNIWHRDRAFP
jgi:hypothetical protein